MRAAATAVLALLVATTAQATERAHRDVTVYVNDRQVQSFDLPDGDALCVLAHVTEEDPVAGTWHLVGTVELRVSAGGRQVWAFEANELVLQRAGVDRLRRRAHAPPLAAGIALPRCAAKA